MSTPSILGGTSYNYPTSGITYPSTTTAADYTWTMPKQVLTVQPSGKIHLEGDDPDIMIGDRSLKQTLEGIERQLNIITQRPDLEDRWAKLTEARQHYEQCLADVIEKETIWNELKR